MAPSVVERSGMTDLEGVPLGAHVVVLSVSPDESVRLARHGLVPGVELVCDQDAPLRGPRIVCVGNQRVSVPRAVARQVAVELIRGQQQ
jgi:Fe2+ transport system protein FeoA